MPANGYFSSGPAVNFDRNWFRWTLNHDTQNPPWDTPNAGSYQFEYNIGTAIGGPFTPAPLTSPGDECSPEPDNLSSPTGVANSVWGIGGPAELLANTDYFIEVILRDPAAAEVGRDVFGPFHTPDYPGYVCLAGPVTTTTATAGLGGASGNTNQAPPCNQDTIVWEIATVPGGPYVAQPSEDATGSPDHMFTGLTPGTSYYVRGRLSEQAQTMGEYLVTQECTITTQAIDLNPVCNAAGPFTDTTGAVAGTADAVPADHTIVLALGTAPGGPYPTLSPATAGDTSVGQSVSHTFTGLAPSTTYYFRTEVRDAGNAIADSSAECTFTTTATPVPPGPMPFQPLPCAADSGGGAAADVEGTLVCDVDAAGNVVGVALVEAVYDDTGARTGTRLVNVTDGTVYVPLGTIQPCSEGCCPEPVVLCDVQADNSTVTFVRTYTGQADGGVTITDQLLDGSVYAPTGIVGSCDPYTTCTPSPNIDLAADCGPGESPNLQLIADDSGTAPDSTVNNDPSADPLCGGQWARAAQPENAPFPVDETFRNATFDQAPAVTQGTAPYFQLTAPSIDPAGQGWGRGSDVNSFTNGMWQVPNPFPASPGTTVEITVAMHDGTATGGDGWVFAFTDGSVPPQAVAIGGGGSLGLANWQGGYVGIVLDSYGGTGAGSEAISIQGIGALVGNIVATSPVNPHKFNATTRAQPLRLRTSIITQFGQSYVSASIDWNDGNGFVQYFDRVNVTPMLGAAPATLRMGTNASSGGAYRDIKEQRDAVAHAAGIEQWRAFPITTDPIPACVTLVTIRACVDLTFTSDTQTTGNSEPDAWLWLVNNATSTVLARTTRTSTPNQVGTTNNICVQADVLPSDIPNLRVYVGADTRDASGAYSTLWENFTVTASGAGCPATPVRTLAISAPCPLPVTIVGGGGDGGGGGTTIFNAPATFEDQPVCMVIAGVTVPGFRREVRSADGSTDVKFLGGDGITVTPDSWTPGGCSARDTELIELCDVQPSGAVVAFLRVFTYDENGDVTSVDNQDANGNPYAPTGTTTVCSLVDTESYILCDQGNGNHQFIHYIVRASGILAALQNTELDGFTPYVPAGPIGLCDDNEVDREGICYTLTSTGTVVHTGWARHDDNIPNTPQTPNGIAFFTNLGVFLDPTADGFTQVPCGATAITVTTRDEEIQILCDSAAVPNRFLRKYNYDGQTGAFIGFTDTTLAGAAFAPVGAVGVCTTITATDLDFAIVTLCDDNGAFLRRFTFNSTTGAVTATTNTTLAGAAYAPVGTVGSCEACCPAVLDGELCTNTGSGHGASLRLANGTVSLIDSVTGAAIAAANIVPCPPANGTLPATVAADHFDVVPGTPWTPAAIPAGRRLVGLSYTVLAGTVVTVDGTGGTSIAGIPAGYGAQWNVQDDRETLTAPPASITADPASRAIVTMVTAL